jgi:hypothetical protein
MNENNLGCISFIIVYVRLLLLYFFSVFLTQAKVTWEESPSRQSLSILLLHISVIPQFAFFGIKQRRSTAIHFFVIAFCLHDSGDCDVYCLKIPSIPVFIALPILLF